jgi:hypothetical protein
MTSRIITAVIIGVLGAFLHVQRTAADESPLKPGIGVGVGADYFTWREVDNSGTRLRESGPRGVLSLSVDNLDRGISGPIYDVTAQGYGGYVYYDGETQSRIPITSHTRYLGGGGEVGAGYRFKDVFNAYSLDLLGAIGVDKWRRAIADTQTGTGAFVRGAEEDYRIVYARMGLGLYRVLNKWTHYIQFGAKRPFSTREEARTLVTPSDCPISGNVTETFVLFPKGGESFYLKWQINKVSNANRREFSLMFYYDSFQFNQSDTASGQTTGVCQAVQPDSHQNVFGTQVGYYFDLF